jgi:hypothetical protein
MKCQEQIHTITNGKIDSIVCKNELIITEGDGKNQRYDVQMECKKCGFRKRMGDKKWRENHCEHCEKELTGQEKRDNGLTCNDPCKLGGLVSGNSK